MTIRLIFILSAIMCLGLATTAFGQAESLVAQVSNSSAESFAGGISGDGRFIVFESNGNLATENPRNADGNLEIFLYDYAQRRTFQITDTKSVLFNTNAAATFNNIRVSIVNTRPVISTDGRWIAFSSNATTSRPATPDATNPGLFDGNSFSSPTPTPTPTPAVSPSPTPTGTPAPTPTPASNPLATDGNTEMWLYQIPAYPPVADLSLGDEVAVTNLAGGTFIRVTNTDTSQTPRAGSNVSGPFIADDNHDASINDDGGVIAFVSTRNLVPAVGNVFPAEDNDEIFTFVRGTNTVQQVTKTVRGNIGNPIYNKNPTISGNGQRVAFTSTGDNPIVGMTGGSNPSTSRNEEIFFSDLDATGAPFGTRKQVTTTTPTNAGDVVNILDLGRRMSRDGRYIAFDSFADLAGENSNTNYISFALYLYDTTTSTFRRIGPRSDADAGASGGDVNHYPTFTDYDVNGLPGTLVFESRLNIKADGTIPTTAADGLNPGEIRSSQIYSYPLNIAPTTATFTRIGKLPDPSSFVASTQILTSTTLRRSAFNIALVEFGTGNTDLQSEVFYLIRPPVTATSMVTALNLFTGATLLPILPTATPSPTPSPSPTATPTATPTPTPSPSPTGSPSPTPTPVTPAAVLGISAGMLAVLDYSANDTPIVARTNAGSFERSPNLPIELSGVSVTINGVGVGLKSVADRRIEFVVPPALGGAVAGSVFPLVINNNGAQIKSFVTIVPTRPDIFRFDNVRAPLGRTKLFNITNTVHTTEPFVIRTIRRNRGPLLVPSLLRIFITGVQGAGPNDFLIRIGGTTIPLASVRTGASIIEPGIYTIDFELPPALEGAGDQPVVVSITVGGVTFTSRVDDTTSRTSIL